MVETDVKWCTYGAWGKKLPTFIGKLEEQQGNTGKIRYSEGQMYPLEYWDMDYVTVHQSLEEAVLFMVEHNGNDSVYGIRDGLHFPSDMKDIDWDVLRIKELEIYKNKTEK